MDFRRWVTVIWLEHVDEIVSLTGKIPPYDAQEYFQRYKWWLRREYRFQQNKIS